MTPDVRPKTLLGDLTRALRTLLNEFAGYEHDDGAARTTVKAIKDAKKLLARAEKELGQTEH